MKHKHKCIWCKVEWECNRPNMDEEAKIDCPAAKKSVCKKCLEKWESHLTKNGRNIYNVINPAYNKVKKCA